PPERCVRAERSHTTPPRSARADVRLRAIGASAGQVLSSLDLVGNRGRTRRRTFHFLCAQLPQQHRGVRLGGKRIPVLHAIGDDQGGSSVFGHHVELRPLLAQV